MELLGPAAGQIQVVIGSMWLVVQVHAGHCFLRHCSLYLRPFVPFIKRCDGDDLGPHIEGCLQGRLIVAAVHSVPSVVVVPRSNAGINIPRSNTGDEKEVVPITESLDGLPVLVRRAKREAVRCKVCIHAIEATCQDVVLVTLLHDQSDKDGVIGRATYTVGASGSQKFRPGLWWSQIGVIDVKQRKTLSCTGGKLVESPVISIPLKTNSTIRKNQI